LYTVTVVSYTPNSGSTWLPATLLETSDPDRNDSVGVFY
jgi:hypothetical protein